MCFVRLHPGLKRDTSVLTVRSGSLQNNNNYARAGQASAATRAHRHDTCVEFRFDMLVLGVFGDPPLHVLAENDKAGVSWMLAGRWTLRAKLAANAGSLYRSSPVDMVTSI